MFVKHIFLGLDFTPVPALKDLDNLRNTMIAKSKVAMEGKDDVDYWKADPWCGHIMWFTIPNSDFLRIGCSKNDKMNRHITKLGPNLSKLIPVGTP